MKTAEQLFQSATVSGENGKPQKTGKGRDKEDKRLKRMKRKIDSKYNTLDIEAEVIDKLTVKCLNCGTSVKLGRAYMIHNLNKHYKRCAKTLATATGMQESISSLFLAMTALSQNVSEKAKEMVRECERLLSNEGNPISALAIKDLKKKHEEIIKAPVPLEALAPDLMSLSSEISSEKNAEALEMCLRVSLRQAKYIKTNRKISATLH